MHLPARCSRPALLALASLCFAACGGSPPNDPNLRQLAWKYGPTNSLSTREHMRGTGTEGGEPLAKGWRLRLKDQRQLTVQPFELAAAHPLFDKVVLAIHLFDQGEQEIHHVVTTPITPTNASFTFDLEPELVAKVKDAIVWYRKP